MKYKLYILTFIVFFTCCEEKYDLITLSKEFNYDFRKLKQDDSGVYMENADSIGSYNSDNLTFIPNSHSISYDFYFEKNNRKFKYIVIDTTHLDPIGKGWRFADYNFNGKLDTNFVNKIILNVIDDNSIAGQTSIEYQYINSYGKIIGKETTGIVENSKNIWIHPPRMHLFRSFIPAPWPYICTPYKIGTKCRYTWKWSDYWADERIFPWNGMLSNVYNYIIKGKANFFLNKKKIECFVIEAEAKSDFGLSKAIFHFNPKYGFLQQDFELPNGKKFVLKAVEINTEQ